MDGGWLSGRFGPHVTMVLGTSMMFLGSISIWTALHSGQQVSLGVLVLMCWLFGHGLGFCDNAGVSTSVKNFPKNKGTAVGLMKALEGITSAVISMTFYTFFAKDDISEYTLILAIAAILVGVFCAPIMYKTNEPATEPDDVVAMKLKVLVIGLLCFIAFCAVVSTQKLYGSVSFVLSMCMLLSMFLLVIPVGSDDQSSKVVSAAAGARALLSKRLDFSVGEMLKTFDFMLVFFAQLVALGVGLMFANNVAVINKAITMNEKADPGLLVAVFSIANASGRVIYGYGSEAMKSQVNRPWFLSLSCLIMFSCMFIVHLGESALVLVSFLIGFALGGSFSLQAVVMEEVFGPKDLPLKYSCCFASASLGSLVFGNIFGKVYDGAAASQQASVCLGAGCYAATTYICAAASFVAFVSVVLFSMRSRKAYACLNDTAPLIDAKSSDCSTQMRSFSENA
eukprot:TRINITY_DN7058_c0_g2_i1.p1 TRINITY_DN7058_c0_g2~~TRINITY_DN7058_c0_g2_i1.p1  ORF type:complete len:518 (-),score=71.70 TRINITY_DN7058_c0_g2_i1:305-1663(-)